MHDLATAAHPAVGRQGSRCRFFVLPSIELADLQEHSAGIRARAVMNDGVFVHDFLIHRTEPMVHVVNAPSPAATSALPIGQTIARQAAESTSG